MIYCEKHNTHTDEQCSKCVIEDREKKLVESSEYFKAMCLRYKELEAQNTETHAMMDCLKEIKDRAIIELEAQIEKAESVLKYYADGRNYSLDSYEGISGEMRSRVVLYGDSTEINDVASQAGRRAREYFESKEVGK